MDTYMILAFCLGFLAGIIFIALVCVAVAHDDPRDEYEAMRKSLRDEQLGINSKGEDKDDQD